MRISEKRVRNWLQVIAALAVPVVIAIGTWRFTAQQSEASAQVAQDQQQETALQMYLDRMSNLLLNNKLRESQPEDEVRNVARARTVTVLPQLNAGRKGELVRFLRQAGLINRENVIIALGGTYLGYADLEYTKLADTSLAGTSGSTGN